MAFCFIVGTQDFTSRLKGYEPFYPATPHFTCLYRFKTLTCAIENVTAQCHNCGNWSAHCISSWDFFTFCWIPIIPLGSKHKDIACSICRFRQDLRNRPEVMSQQGGHGQVPPPGQQQQHGGAPQGWSQQQQQQGGPPPHQYK